jgi:hypothetical protein
MSFFPYSWFSYIIVVKEQPVFRSTSTKRVASSLKYNPIYFRRYIFILWPQKEVSWIDPLHTPSSFHAIPTNVIVHVYSCLVVCAFYFIHANVSSDNHVITCARVAVVGRKSEALCVIFSFFHGIPFGGLSVEAMTTAYLELLPPWILKWRQ